jgi:hypothetical protein
MMPQRYRKGTGIAAIEELMDAAKTKNVTFAAIERFGTTEEMKDFFPHYVEYLKISNGNPLYCDPIKSAMANFRYVLKTFYHKKDLHLWNHAFAEISTAIKTGQQTTTGDESKLLRRTTSS